MQWPDTIAVSAGAAAGYEVGAARDALRGDDGRLAAGLVAAAGAFSGLDLPCSDEPDLFFAESPAGCGVREGALPRLPRTSRLHGRGHRAPGALGSLGRRTLPAWRGRSAQAAAWAAA